MPCHPTVWGGLTQTWCATEEVKGNWLREVDFFTGGGPSEAGEEPSEERGAAATVQVLGLSP